MYKISLAAPGAFTFSVEGSNEADLGIYFLNAGDLSDRAEFCDNLGRASPPESCLIALPAGDYILAVVNFGQFYPELDPDPAFIELNIN